MGEVAGHLGPQGILIYPPGTGLCCAAADENGASPSRHAMGDAEPTGGAMAIPVMSQCVTRVPGLTP